MIVVVVYFLAAAILVLLLKRFANLSFSSAFSVVFSTILALHTLANLGQLVFVRPRAEPVLLEVEAQRRGWFIALFIFYLLTALLALISQENVILWLRSQASRLIFATLWAVLAFSKLQIRQRGIWLGTNLLPWDKIRSYRWQRGTLHFETQRPWLLSVWASTSCVVPEAHVEAFEKYLLEHGIPDHTAGSLATA